MSTGNPNKRFKSYMLLILAVALLAWALLRAYDIVQDHKADDAPAGAVQR